MAFMDLEKAFDCVPVEYLGVEGKYKKDQGHDLRYRPGPPAEFIWDHIQFLSYRIGIYCKCCVYIRNAAGYNDCMISNPVIGVHSAGELQVLTSTHISYKTLGYVYNSCAECHAPCQWN